MNPWRAAAHAYRYRTSDAPQRRRLPRSTLRVPAFRPPSEYGRRIPDRSAARVIGARRVRAAGRSSRSVGTREPRWSGVGHDERDSVGEPRPFVGFDAKLLASGAGDLVVARLSIVGGDAPVRSDPPLARHAMERRVK